MPTPILTIAFEQIGYYSCPFYSPSAIISSEPIVTSRSTSIGSTVTTGLKYSIVAAMRSISINTWKYQ